MMLVDSNEPDNIVKLLQQAVPVTVINLNTQHMSDYYFSNYEGKTLQFSRKQAGELLSNVDEAEDQLRDYYQQADENFQLVEGIISPQPLTICTDKQLHSLWAGALTWSELRYKPAILRPAIPSSRISAQPSFSYKVGSITDKLGVTVGILSGQEHEFHFSILYAWLHRLAQCGIVTYWTINWMETAKLLATIYRNEQKPTEEHSTLRRIIKPRLQIKDADPFIKALLYLSSAYKLDIGEIKAKALADKFCNLLDLATASISDVMAVEGVGKKIAGKLLSALGRSNAT